MRELTISAAAVRALLELTVARGAGRAEIVARSEIDPTELQDRDNRLPFRKYVALMRAGQELCNDPALALHFGESVDASEISISCTEWGAGSIDEACAQGNRYAALTVEVETDESGERFHLCRTNGDLWLMDQRRNPNDFPELTESAFARMVCKARRHLGDLQVIKEVHVTHAEPAYRAEYERIFRVPVLFGSDRNAMRIDEAVMTSVLPPPSPKYVTEILKEHAESQLQKLKKSQSTRGRVETLLVPMLQTGDVRMDTVAGRLGVSRQTLFRKLKAESVTFETVLEELRCSMAHHYLSEKKSVKATAYLVGFSDPAAFSRAFKRWTGRAPGR